MSLLPIETRRTVLRAVSESDVDAVHAILGDDETIAGRSWRQANREGTLGWIERRAAQERELGFSMWAVELRATAQIVGLCGFFPHEPACVELGYVIRADHWNRGLASEVVQAVVSAASDASLGVIATIRTTNERSLAVARRVGLVAVDTIDDDHGRLVVFRSEVTGD